MACENALRAIFDLPPASEAGVPDAVAFTREAVFASAKSLALFSQYVPNQALLKCG
jgi:hypothetical protein